MAKGNVDEDLSKQAKISEPDGRKIALARVPSDVRSEELEREHHRVVYSYDINPVLRRSSIDAFGKACADPTWCSSAKDLVSAALGRSRIWFSIGHGILNEVYFPEQVWDAAPIPNRFLYPARPREVRCLSCGHTRSS